MTKPGWPSPQSWHDLIKVVWNLDLIVDDAPQPPRPGPWSAGLLGVPFTPPQEDKPQEPSSSRLEAEPDDPLRPNVRSELERILPGISSIGGNRAERLENLRRRLLKQPAYVWLIGQPSFQSAIETTRYLAKRGNSSYQVDSVDFKLIAAAWLPLILYGQETSFGYPTRDEIKSAIDNAEALVDFVKKSGGLQRKGKLTFGHRAALERLAEELHAVYGKKYKKPKEDDPVAEVEFGIELAVGLKREFGSVSRTIVSAFLDLIEYVHDEARAREIIRMAEVREGGN